MTDRTFEMRQVAAAPEVPDGFEYRWANVTGDGAGLILQVAASDAAEVPYRVVHVLPDGTDWVVETPPLPRGLYFLDTFSDGRLLMVAPRSRWRGPDDYDLNAAVFDPVGGTTRRVLLGDGIAAVGVDRRDRIWVSYFDEGVFGNLGWSRQGAPRNLGSGGLVCFDVDGARLWSANETLVGREIGGISDCYAMNVAADGVWAYVYTDFPVIEVGFDFETSVHGPFGVSGAHALAGSDQAFLFSGGYGDPDDTFHLVQRVGGNREELRASFPETTSFAANRLLGRGSEMHLIGPDGWFRCDLRELA